MGTMYERKFQFSNERSYIFYRMVDHAFLGRKPPDVNIDLKQTELNLLSLMDDAINNMDDRIIPRRVRLLFDNMHALYHQDEIKSEMIADQIRGINNPRDMMGIYVRSANCGLFLSQTQTATITLATFQPNLSNKEIYGSRKAPNGDIQVDYPTRAVKVKKSELIDSEVFAEQISRLHLTKCDRNNGKAFERIEGDMPSTKFVSQWLVGAVSDRESSVDPNFPIISKKMRDEPTLCFRRSGFWTAIKVFLQLGLTIELGPEYGEFVYKLTMLKFLCSMCDCFNMPAYDLTNLNVDVAMEMLAKTARRLDKLSKYSDVINDSPLYGEVAANIRAEVTDCISKVRIKLQELHIEMQANEQIECELRFDQLLGIEEHVKHKLSNEFKGYLEKRMNEDNDSENNVQMQSNADRSHVSKDDRTLQELISAEEKVFNFDNQQIETSALRDIATSYIKRAKVLYRNDPFGYSRMVLTVLRIIQILDKIACEEHPALKRHRPGINIKIFDNLILASRHHLEIAYDAQQYFLRRRGRADLPGLLEEDEITEKSFSARFVNVEMNILRRKINALDIKNVKKKYSELKRVRAETNRKSVELKRMMCRFPIKVGSACRKADCEKCNLHDEIENTMITVYKRLLKPEHHNENAIIFELCIPLSIACLRDVLFLFARAHYSGQFQSIKTVVPWTKRAALKDFSNGNSRNVFLISESSGARTRARAAALKKRYDSLSDGFVDDKVAEYNCLMSGSVGKDEAKQAFTKMPKKTNQQSIKKFVTFNVEEDPIYKVLQPRLETTSHTQNDVLASNPQCPADMNLLEFINFGSLRADGQLLQIRNLNRMIIEDGLSFEKPSVLALVMQTLWEAGPVNHEAPLGRDSTVDLMNVDFAWSFINVLETYTQRHRTNWRHPLKLLVAILIACRIFEINTDPGVINRAMRLLLKCRSILIEWIPLIHDSIEQNQNNRKNPSSLYENLLDVAICGIFTYFIDPHHEYFTKIFETAGEYSAVFAWLYFIQTMSLNTSLCKKKSQVQLLRMAHTIGLNIRTQMRDRIAVNEVQKVVRRQYSETVVGNIDDLRYLEGFIFEIFVSIGGRTSISSIRIDYVYGDFLVNGAPMGHLPESITESDAFRRVFGDTVINVNPLNGSFHTWYPFNGHTYIFSEDDGVIIIERDTSREYELIPHTILKDSVSFLLVENFNHWWNKRRNVIEFQPKWQEDPVFVEPNAQYEFDLISYHLKHLKTKRLLLDVQSTSFRQITNQLSRLEHENYIHVLMEQGTPVKAEVQLVRMNLNFIVDCTPSNVGHSIESCEYRNMRVCAQRNFETLFGLRHGLLLEPIDGKATNRLLIMPHGKIMVRPSDKHVLVEVETEETELREPPFFLYKFQDECRTLKANNFAAWFYLAYLHALTSYPLPDPFTGMTGVQRALHILQTGFVWSAEPYDSESRRILESLANLSPKRELQDPHLYQITHWPRAACVHRHVAQDAFKLIVNKLIEDSNRLLRSDPPYSAQHLALNLRAHVRYVPYTPNYRISESLMECDDHVAHFKAKEVDKKNMANVRQLAANYSKREFIIPPSANLTEFIVSLWKSEKSMKNDVRATGEGVTDFCFSNTFVDLWIRLYECARNKEFPRDRFHMILCLLAYEGVDVNYLHILQTIAENRELFADLAAPSHAMYVYPGYSEYNALTGAIGRGGTSAIPAYAVILKAQRKNEDLLRFTRSLSDGLQQLRDQSSPMFKKKPKWPVSVVEFRYAFNSKYQIDFNTKMRQNYQLPEFARKIALAQAIFVDKSGQAKLKEQHWKQFVNISIPKKDKYLNDAGLFPRLVPVTVLPMISPRHPAQRSVCDEQKYLIGAIAVLTVRLQRANRIERLRKKMDEVALRLEEENPLHNDWRPDAYPEWLLLEIEMDLSIRRIQVEVAKEMINPRSGSNSVMQLNMGEGKTSVILPIIAAHLANGDQLSTVTVLKHLFQTNLPSLRQSVGGLLMRRVYTMPCNRKIDINLIAPKLLDIYEECKRERGILLTLPEYRLSFQLKMYETAQLATANKAAATKAAAEQLLGAYNWLEENSRHIMDESDAILDAKYQLIYTIGEQLEPDGGSLRWTCVQAVLKRVPHHMKELFDLHGDQKIEFNLNYTCDGEDYGHGDVRNRPEVFRPCRLLDASVYDELKMRLIDDFVEGHLIPDWRETSPMLYEMVREFLRNAELSADRAKFLLYQFAESERNTLLILSGLLKFDILQLALSKRWRVNYGRNVHGNRKMAVPYKAKDVASEMTEFGHPDVAICLTQLSYYYSGLSDNELIQAFQHLEQNEDRNAIYGEWVSPVPPHLVDPTIELYENVNLLDPRQRNDLLFPVLRRNMYVIDYWLSEVVFPHEAKVFQRKLMCTPWDLCTAKRLVTGFSGTNDTKKLLPMPIEQNDLPQLEKTNENNRRILMLPENDNYQRLPPNVSGMDILRRLVEHEMPVLLDAGALMLELNNAQVAREWLNLAPSETYDAAIYFDEKNVLQTIDRRDFIIKFEYSVYREQLDRCLVYLDDEHTRGTDLKFPEGIRACVTLSGGITRDKTVQACMRMRLLGQPGRQGHRISFWASHEADIGIRNLSNGNITSANVIDYITENSRKLENDGMVHWSIAAHNYMQKLAAHMKLMKSNNRTLDDFRLFGQRCSAADNSRLKDMYGEKQESKLTTITDFAFTKLRSDYPGQKDITRKISTTAELVVDKLYENVPETIRYTAALEEQQEKVLENELDENRDVCHLLSKSPLKPFADPLLRKFFGSDSDRWSVFAELKASKAIEPLPFGFKNSEFFPMMIEPEIAAWDENIFVTKDFLSVIDLGTNDEDDKHLRPVWWIVQVSADHDANQNADAFVIISPFECNAWMHIFRTGSKSSLHMFSAKLSESQQSLYNNRAMLLPVDSQSTDIPLPIIVQISLFAGSMYFENAAEEEAYCSFMGFIPAPRTEEQEIAVRRGFIDNNGFVMFRNRDRFPYITSRFKTNPEKIATKIIELRYGNSRKRSHVESIVHKARRCRWDNGQ